MLRQPHPMTAPAVTIVMNSDALDVRVLTPQACSDDVFDLGPVCLFHRCSWPPTFGDGHLSISHAFKAAP